MRFGYYLAQDRSAHGDPALALIAGRAWRRSNHRSPGRFDGCAVWMREGVHVVRFVMRDLFGMATVQFPPSPPFEIAGYRTYDERPPADGEKP